MFIPQQADIRSSFSVDSSVRPNSELILSFSFADSKSLRYDSDYVVIGVTALTYETDPVLKNSEQRNLE
ncbi:hypothetical protein Y032_0223g2684 [Ancylostoma ceylanicum]|uniref:Uncharacterized protein n=1 Tax=Ancylostoma ceylanicum TaxID=53326 RepID=A0A016SIL1_9BILA|nr:hypothetical protein Y032_0223g2684 [Ancylostoma ceylanicum]